MEMSIKHTPDYKIVQVYHIKWAVHEQIYIHQQFSHRHVLLMFKVCQIGPAEKMSVTLKQTCFGFVEGSAAYKILSVASTDTEHDENAFYLSRFYRWGKCLLKLKHISPVALDIL